MCSGGKGWPSSSPSPLCSDWTQQEHLLRRQASCTLYMIKTPFYKILSQLSTHTYTHPYIKLHVTHYLAACRPAGCVIRGYRRQQQQAVGGCLPRCGFLRAFDHVSDSFRKSNTSISKKPVTILLKCKNHS